ncbi:UDP-glucose dehydrogenase family protein [Sporolactobacillus spathodeae]|uniref:UDP-glucose 6-dehydrogenase n=1 Tax=Sporolactobacillus spathodeae TaxID=1465502 RepID=A0ABS2QAY6_9BACL|nr:UDP-glucose/GDP-mannose dehydrogenase family protein [Sporolactobacillus spathodeae]MBM7658786.1 UDPglucose 6-dehydrogenase [Sporolactobacillus spathodeae]
MKIAVIGTGYVGLVTGVALAEIGHTVTCIDIDSDKVKTLNHGIPTIYEPGLGEMMQRNMQNARLFFTADYARGLDRARVVYLAVGTPERPDGSANLDYVRQAARDLAAHISHPLIVVIKSTVPVGTNYKIQRLINRLVPEDMRVTIASNPEFLREGSAIHDTFHGDRIVIGTDNPAAAEVLEEINRPFGLPILHTDICSSEMIKYASNAFLATKISFINEIANLCEKLGADVEEVAQGMGLDHRIGPDFLKAGIGYGGSCFPKDTHALVQLAGNHHHDFNLLKSVIEVNRQQQRLLLEKIENRLGGDLAGKRLAVLGLAFKPNTDDMRESPALVMVPELAKRGADLIAYDPIASGRAEQLLGQVAVFTNHVDEALREADCAVILTDWPDIRKMEPETYKRLMKHAIVFDGRNCYSPNEMRRAGIDYYSIGRPNRATEFIF